MTERAFLKECAPQIAEIVYECQKIDPKEYIDIKRELLEKVDERVRPFMSKVFMIVEQCLAEK